MSGASQHDRGGKAVGTRSNADGVWHDSDLR
jgi:hypothetical protein